MTRELFPKWLNIINKKMKILQKKILLILDDASPHLKQPQLSNITLYFLPANTKSKIQTHNQGIIALFKNHYKTFLI